MKKEMQYAWLSNETGYTVFRFDDKVIRFRAPYSLERYTAVKEYIMNQGAFRTGADYVAAVLRAKEAAQKTF